MSNEGSAAEAKKVFVISPIGAVGSEINRRATYFLDYLVRRALPVPNWEVHRADEGSSPDSIGQHVVKSINEADLVVADLSGHNPNVFYELAIAHGWRKPVVHLITDGESIPFDIIDIRTIFYDITDLRSVDNATNKLREYAEHAIDNVEDLVTPLSSYGQFAAIRSNAEDGGSAVADALEQVMTRLSHIEKRLQQPALQPGLFDSASSRKQWEAAKLDEALDQILGSDKDDALTGREREIVALVAEGLSNDEIANKLFVSRRTVEGHLYRAFTKLGVTDRGELRKYL
jgi:DNA-binding CsgD family transcriptional regulator